LILVVIVEDEMLVRMGLKTCLEANREISVKGCFDSAERALAFFEKNQADVIITDIRLPGMSGLDLIHQLRERFPSMIMVVLSAYEDFTYAQKAITYSADRYILKHELDEEKLPQIVVEMVHNTKPLQSLHSKENKLSGDVQKYCDNGGARVMYFHFRSRESAFAVTKDELSLEMVTGLICTALEDKNLGYGYLDRQNQVIALLHSKPQDNTEIKECFHAIGDSLNLYANIACFSGVSEWFMTPDALSVAIDEANERCKLAFYYEDNHIFITQNMSDGSCPPLTFVREDAFTASWLRSTLDSLDEFVGLCAKLMPDVEQVRETLMCFLHALVYYGEHFYGLKVQESQKEALTYQTICRFDSIFATKSWLVQVVERIQRSINQRQDIAHSIRGYLEQNYMHELPQSVGSSHFYLSTSYFSQYFKQQFGQTYIQYLHALRIEQAKRLLRTTQDSTEAICARVGIPNVNYFFRLFKKIEGRTVKAYRREHKEKP